MGNLAESYASRPNSFDLSKKVDPFKTFLGEVEERHATVERKRRLAEEARATVVFFSVFRVVLCENAPSLFLTIAFFSLQYNAQLLQRRRKLRCCRQSFDV